MRIFALGSHDEKVEGVLGGDEKMRIICWIKGIYWTLRRCGKGGKRVYSKNDFDFMALVALDKSIIGYVKPDLVRGTMILNEEKLRSLTFEKLCTN